MLSTSDMHVAQMFVYFVNNNKLPQFLHRLQNKEKPMQNNFEAQVWQLKMVFECSIAWCDLGLGRATVHCQRNHPRKPKFSRNRAILSDHFLGVKFYNGLFFGSAFFWFCIGLFQYRQVLLEEQCSQRFQITTTSASDILTLM